jgi:hypothetical protein
MIYNNAEDIHFAVLPSFLNPINNSIPLSNECGF